MEIYFIATHAQNMENSKDYIASTEISLKKEAKKCNNYILKEISKRIFPVELKNIDSYSKFGLNKLFTHLFEKMENQKINFTINSNNFKNINSIFFQNIRNENDIIEQATSLSNRIINNFSFLASSIGVNFNVKGTTMLSTAVIKIIYKIYNKVITTNECLEIIERYGYTNEFVQNDSIKRTFSKLLYSITYKYGPAAEEIENIGLRCIKINNEELKTNKRKLFDYINNYRKAINYSIDCLKKIDD